MNYLNCGSPLGYWKRQRQSECHVSCCYQRTTNTHQPSSPLSPGSTFHGGRYFSVVIKRISGVSCWRGLCFHHIVRTHSGKYVVCRMLSNRRYRRHDLYSGYIQIHIGDTHTMTPTIWCHGDTKCFQNDLITCVSAVRALWQPNYGSCSSWQIHSIVPDQRAYIMVSVVGRHTIEYVHARIFVCNLNELIEFVRAACFINGQTTKYTQKHTDLCWQQYCGT